MHEMECYPVPHDYSVAADEVHVWRIVLDWPLTRIEAMTSLLSADERQKAARFHFAQDRVRSIVGRGALRALLARCARTEPKQLCFDYDSFGKPHLAKNFSDRPWQFNISHSGNLVLIALTIGRAIGVDVEKIRSDLETEQVAARFFSPSERRALQSVPEHLRFGAFFDCWTRKEAYVKAIGGGLSLPLDQFDVSLRPEEVARLLATRPDPAEAGRWAIQALDVGADYRAAVAVEGTDWRLRMWDWRLNANDPVGASMSSEND
jgi:4'-phosphopantetheinyl transferase